MTPIRSGLLATFLVFHGVSFSQADETDAQTQPQYTPEEKTALKDAKEYFDMLEKYKDEPLESQIEHWQNFLANHPSHSMEAEIRNNIEELDKLLSQTDPKRKKEEKDTVIYFKALDYIKRHHLSDRDQILLWNQFMQDNPKSIYLPEIEKRLRELRSKTPAKPSSSQNSKPLATPSPTSTVSAKSSGTRITDPEPKPIYLAPEKRPYKDSQKALLIGSLVGLIAPGSGHWYTQEYPIAGVLNGLGLIGISIGAAGIAQGQDRYTLAGTLLYGISYLIGVGDAPFSARRYNDKLDRLYEQSMANQKLHQLLAMKF
ncbi:MAG: hypothetical protein R3A11_04860 [Bdellovibrionota bacterium]